MSCNTYFLTFKVTMKSCSHPSWNIERLCDEMLQNLIDVTFKN